MVEIIPSLLVESEKEFIEKYNGLKNSVDMVQIDIADGIFVSHTTWADPQKIKEIVECEIELHFMVQNPLEYFSSWQDVPRVKRIYFHIEPVELLDNVIFEARENGWEVGVALKPETPLDALEPIINDIDAVLFLSVNPGKQGQAFIPEVLEKIKDFRKKGYAHFVSLDGGVNKDTLSDILPVGVDAVCPGSAVFSSGNPEQNVHQLKQVIQETRNKKQ